MKNERELAKSAKLQPITPPVAPESGYIPSKAMTEFVRARDLTCRAPGFATGLPRIAMSTTPSHSVSAEPRIRRTSNAFAENISDWLKNTLRRAATRAKSLHRATPMQLYDGQYPRVAVLR
jgi:hypothetical protein